MALVTGMDVVACIKTHASKEGFFVIKKIPQGAEG